MNKGGYRYDTREKKDYQEIQEIIANEAKHEDFSSLEAYEIFYKLQVLSSLLMCSQNELKLGEIHALGYVLSDIALEFQQMDPEIVV